MGQVALSLVYPGVEGGQLALKLQKFHLCIINVKLSQLAQIEIFLCGLHLKLRQVDTSFKMRPLLAARLHRRCLSRPSVKRGQFTKQFGEFILHLKDREHSAFAQIELLLFPGHLGLHGLNLGQYRFPVSATGLFGLRIAGSGGLRGLDLEGLCEDGPALLGQLGLIREFRNQALVGCDGQVVLSLLSIALCQTKQGRRGGFSLLAKLGDKPGAIAAAKLSSATNSADGGLAQANEALVASLK